MQRLQALEKRVYVASSKLCNGLGLFALEDIKEGEVIYEFKGRLIKGDMTNISNPYVLQLDFLLYLLPFGEGKYLNHSCDPNTKLLYESGRLYLVAIKNIKANDELCYNYNTSEYDMGVDSFECTCKSNNCIKNVRGFKYLSKEERYKIKDLLLPYLKKLL